MNRDSLCGLWIVRHDKGVCTQGLPLLLNGDLYSTEWKTGCSPWSVKIVDIMVYFARVNMDEYQEILQTILLSHQNEKVN